MGHTTGAACVNLLMLSPVARGKAAHQFLGQHENQSHISFCISNWRLIQSRDSDVRLGAVGLGDFAAPARGDDPAAGAVELPVARRQRGDADVPAEKALSGHSERARVDVRLRNGLRSDR